MSGQDDLRVIDQVHRRRASPELSKAFADAVLKLFQGCGWLASPVALEDFDAIPPLYDDVSAAFRAASGDYVDLRIGATNERHADIVCLISRVLALTACGCGRLPDSPIETRRLVVDVMARSERLPADAASLDACLSIPAFGCAVDELLAALDEMRGEEVPA
ncbi:hypothetical protein [Paraburkholderia solisilvae]|uniref:Uncharacterized protein n=1 Tax=Paraburkholderia solisilvae TaxID=624376 RepID=A0A6J5DHX0_9BURK|nr:hypothetical protein [Paraburkholderia solisilvae]CAB3753074.1 hypothetical protein LMG29739_01660 [Paraburkholderia solisilvae]